MINNLPLLMPSMSYNLDDLRRCASSEGVNLIPFPDLRSSATSISEQVERAKSDLRSLGDADPFIAQKNNVLSELKEYRENIEKENRDSFPRKEVIEMNTEEINKSEAKLRELNAILSNALDLSAALLTARSMLREYFSKALSQLSDLSSNPERVLGSGPSDDDKKQLEEYIKEIRRKIEDGERVHKDEEDAVTRNRDKVSAALDKSQ
jgi:hypothetical protein